jgi:hypothetical protein
MWPFKKKHKVVISKPKTLEEMAFDGFLCRYIHVLGDYKDPHNPAVFTINDMRAAFLEGLALNLREVYKLPKESEVTNDY